MKIPSLLEDPIGHFFFFLAHWARRKGDYASARSKLGRVFRRGEGNWEFLIPYDATLMMLEGRFEDSIDRFEQGWRIYSINSDPNSEYLASYCRCFISLFAGDGLETDLIEGARSLDADPVITTLFKFPEENTLPEFFRLQRGAPSQQRP